MHGIFLLCSLNLYLERHTQRNTLEHVQLHQDSELRAGGTLALFIFKDKHFNNNIKMI